MLASCSASKKVCLFIDGLDELEGDHSTLVEMVKEMTMVPGVKVCVSSRPWPVFQETFLSEPSLMLQDLTFRDIELYATENLEQNSGFRDLRREDPIFSQELVLTITRKSSGVFLWVRLVVESLLKGLRDGDRVQDLQRRLEDLPDDLEKLFLKMLDSIEEPYRGHASQIFQLHRAACTPPTLLFLSLADEDSARFALDLETRPLDLSALDARCRRMKRCLESRCKGFLEIAPEVTGYLPQSQALMPSSIAETTETAPLAVNAEVGIRNASVIDHAHSAQTAKHEGNRRVEYLHRTVKDFFAMKEVWLKVTDGTPTDFIPSRRLCAAAVAQIKVTPARSLTTDLIWDFTTSTLEYALYSEVRIGQPEARLLDELDLTLSDLTNIPSQNGRTFLEKHLDNVPFQGHWTNTRFSWHTSAPFLHLTAMCGLSLYVEHKLQPNFAIIQEESKNDFTSLLYSATCSGAFSYYSDKPLCSRTTPHLPTIRLLVDNGADPHQMHCGLSPWLHVATRARRKAVPDHDTNAWLEVFEAFGGQRTQLYQQMPYGHSPPIEQPVPRNLFAWKPIIGNRYINFAAVLHDVCGVLKSGMMEAMGIENLATRTDSTDASHPRTFTGNQWEINLSSKLAEYGSNRDLSERMADFADGDNVR